MKKTVTLILILVVLAVGAALLPALMQDGVAFADSAITVAGSNVTVHRGQTFSMDITLSDNDGLVSLLVLVEYDNTAMKLQSVTRGSALESFTFDHTKQEEWYKYSQFDGGIRFLWYGGVPDTSNGVLLTLEFESNIAADIGDYDVEINYDIDNTFAYYDDNKGIPANVATQNGIVTLIKGAYSVEYYNYDDALLWSKDYNNPDERPTAYGGPTPTRPTDDMYSYVFNGTWRGIVSTEKGVIKYRAEYDTSPVEYIVRYFVDGEMFYLDSGFYGETLDLPDTTKANYTFYGWYTDATFKQKAHYPLPANSSHEWDLYGYYKYNIREDNIPELALTATESGGNLVVIDATLIANPGILSMNLTLNYDRKNLSFKGFKAGSAFSGAIVFTNDDAITLDADGFYRAKSGSSITADPFVFSFENGAENSTECALVVRMEFEISSTAPNGVYQVTFDYNKSTDISYLDDSGEMWYTMLDIVAAKVPHGSVDHWSSSVQEDSSISVEISSSAGLHPQTKLIVHDVSGSLQLSSSATDTLGEQEVKKAYSLTFEQDGVVVEPSGTYQVKIKLKAAITNATLYSLGADGSLTKCSSSIEGDQIVFTVDKLGTFVIAGDKSSTTKPPDGPSGPGDDNPGGDDPGGDNPGGNNPGGDTPPSGGPLDGLPWMYIAFGAAGLAVVLLLVLIIVAAKKKKK